MTSRTRTWLLVALVAVGITIPAESVLLQALTTPSQQQMAQDWIGSLSASTVDAVADQIESYPFAYRRAIMAELTPARRAEVWQRHISMYLNSHPGLDPNAVTALQAALALATPDAFAPHASEGLQAQVQAVGDQVRVLLGADEASYVLYRLGPKDGEFTSLEPVTQKIANWIRSTFVVEAGAVHDCTCNIDFGCDGQSTYCGENTGCTVVQPWPACGWFWNQDCDGYCKAGIPGGN